MDMPEIKGSIKSQLPVDVMRKAAVGISYIGHPIRLRILEYLDVMGDSCVCHIAKGICEEQTIVSQNLKKLRDAKLVETNRCGIFIRYSICKEYPASIFVCLRKLFGYMSNDLYFLKDDYKAILPRDYTSMSANRIKLFAHFHKMRILEYLLIKGSSPVNVIADGIALSQLQTSQFLKKLKEDDFVSCERSGKFIFYSPLKGVQTTAIQCIHKRYDSLTDKEKF